MFVYKLETVLKIVGMLNLMNSMMKRLSLFLKKSCFTSATLTNFYTESFSISILKFKNLQRIHIFLKIVIQFSKKLVKKEKKIIFALK